MKQRLQKIIAAAGYGSRRSVEKMISEKRIILNNKIAILGQQATIDDVVRIDGRVINLKRYYEQEIKVIMLNKKIGYICSKKDEKNRPTVYSLLPKNTNWIMVGRLDINSSGLLLFTNNGALANKLMHPSSNIAREYSVRVLGNVSKEDTEQLKNGIELDDGFAKFDNIKMLNDKGANKWYKVSLTEGKNREVRRLWEKLGFKVSRLIRIKFANIAMPHNLRANQILILKTIQINKLINI